MSQHHPFRILSCLTAIFAAFLSTAMVSNASDGIKIRFVCVSGIDEYPELVLASRDQDGKWKEYGTVGIRTSAITDWLPAHPGELHLAVRENADLKSICSFNCPADNRRALVALVADPDKKIYNAHLIDAEKSRFVEGSILIANFSESAGSVFLGISEQKIEAGQQVVAKPTPEDGGMYRLMASYIDADGKNVMCYDRQVSANLDSREMLFLLPDKSLGMKILSIPLFGKID